MVDYINCVVKRGVRLYPLELVKVISTPVNGEANIVFTCTMHNVATRSKKCLCANVLVKMFDSRSNIESHFNAMLKAASSGIMFIITAFRTGCWTNMHDGLVGG